MRHQTLTEIETLIQKILVTMTNQAYSMGHKFSYRISWTKGTGEVELDQKRYKNYFTLRFWMVDKTDSPSGKEITLLTNHYVPVALQTKEKLEEEAYKEFLLNSVRCLFNNTYATYLQSKQQEFVQPTDVELNEVVENLKEQAKTPKIIMG